MQYIYGKDFKFSNTCVAFGQFDGLHLGHRAVINKLFEVKKINNLSSVLLSFDFKPSNIFGADSVIYTEEEKRLILGENAPDIMISYPFTFETADIEAEEFIKDILIDKLGAKIIVTNENCRFGKQCKGNIELLKNLSSKYGYSVICVETVKEDGETVSSEIIRSALNNGLIKKANKLLGHPFTMFGEIVHGKALGRTVGMPTANLSVPENKLIPKHGVYATMSNIDKKLVKGLTNIGLRPSVDNNEYITIETFLLDFSEDIYGKKIALEILSFIRDIKKFKNIDEVKKQVEKDIEIVRAS